MPLNEVTNLLNAQQNNANLTDNNTLVTLTKENNTKKLVIIEIHETLSNNSNKS